MRHDKLYVKRKGKVGRKINRIIKIDNLEREERRMRQNVTTKLKVLQGPYQMVKTTWLCDEVPMTAAVRSNVI
jgi:hypothetical protein